MICPVKRLAVTVLIALYTMVLMWGTVDRTYNWAAQQSDAMAHRTSDDADAVGKPRPVSAPHQAHRRIIENPFVIEPPLLTAWNERAPEFLQQSMDRWIAGPDTHRLQGRAPPTSLQSL